jgi:hypothetical protein
MSRWHFGDIQSDMTSSKRGDEAIFIIGGTFSLLPESAATASKEAKYNKNEQH